MPPARDVTTWRKSSYSNQDGGECVEVSFDLDGLIPVRDSKVGDDRVLVFQDECWSAFLASVKLR